MSERIYVVDGDRLTALSPAAPPGEDRLQELIAEHSDLIGEEDGELLLVRREQGVADSEDGASRWSLDHLFVTRDATPVLVEVKRAVDTRLRREVVGQLLDYAANGAQYWTAAQAELSFRTTHEAIGSDPDERLTEFLAESAIEPADFWNQVETRLRAGDMKLLIVADRIPAELARIVEFLNKQMRAEIYAIELRYYSSEAGLLTLVPRAIGRTEETKAKTGRRGRLEPVSIDEWIARDIGSKPGMMAGTQAWLASVAALGGTVQVASTQGSLVACVTNSQGKGRYPCHLNRPGRVAISFGWTYTHPGLRDETVRQVLLDRFTDAVGPLSTANLQGSPSFPVERLADAMVAEKFQSVLRDYIALAVADEEDPAQTLSPQS